MENTMTTISDHRLHNVVMARFDAIANAEKITRAELAALSRELLIYVPDTQDIQFINRLMGVLTPVNRRVAILYFGHFLPWEKENDTDGTFLRFGKKMLGEKKLTKRMMAIADWLADENNTIWTWSDENVSIDKKKDFKSGVVRAIKNALAGDEKTDSPALDPMEVMAAIFEGGMTLDAMLVAVERRQQEIAAVEAAANDVMANDMQEAA
jgi:hypothetical protein